MSETETTSSPSAVGDRPRRRSSTAQSSGIQLAGNLRRASLYLFIGVLAWAPAPLASNRPWAMSLLTLATGVAISLWALGTSLSGEKADSPLARIKIPAIAFGFAGAWILVQWAPFTPQMFHHPIWGEARSLAEIGGAGRISVNPYLTLSGLMNLATYCAAFWLAYQFAARRERADLLLKSILIIGVGYALFGLAVEFAGADILLFTQKEAYLGSLTSTFVGRNAYAGYAGFGLITGLSILLWGAADAASTRRDWRKQTAKIINTGMGGLTYYLAAVAILACALLLSDSRWGFFSASAGTATVIIMAVIGRRLKFWQGAGLLLVFTVATVSLLLATPEAVLDRLGASGEDYDTRMGIYGVTWDMIGASPLWGVGYGGFADAFPAYRDGMAGELYHFRKAHSAYLQTIAELGWPGAIAIFVGLGAIFVQCATGVAKRRRHRVYAAITVSVCVAAGLHSLFDFSIQIPAVAYTFAAILGIGAAQSYSRRTQ